MAYTKKRSRKKKSKYTEVEKLAYNMGKVERGLKNPNSRITESFKNGKEPKERKAKKSLY